MPAMSPQDPPPPQPTLNRRLVLAALAAGAAATLPGCASAPPAVSTDADGAVWQAVSLPGKPATEYRWTHKQGRRALAAVADRSASMKRRRLQLPAEDVSEVSFSWWVDQLIPQADVSRAETEDAPVKLLFAFDGDHGRLTPRNRRLFDLAEALTGERPPFATLVYVWDPRAATETVIPNPRTDRIRKIVLDSGHSGLGRWRDHRRDLAADFRRAFGENPGALLSVAVMTDGDNTGSQTRAWYGPIAFHPSPAR